jgi:hypothetical protein
MRADKLSRVLTLAAGLALFAWFVFVVRGGLASWFDADDLINIHRYWVNPWSVLLQANLAFWSSYYRPAGGLFYLSIYDLWGFNPLPFRIAVLVLLSVDFALLAVVVWQLTGSRWSALIALLLVGINASFSAAYFDTGTVYDVLAYVFFWGAFALYVRFRHAGRPLGWGRLALVGCLFVLALDAKEIAVSLPVALGLYELVWHPPANWKLAGLWRWIRQEGRFALIGGFADIAYIAGKRYGPDSLWEVGPYQPHYSVAAYFQSLSEYLRQLIYKPVTISSWKMAALLAAILAVAAATRRRCLLWAVGFIAVGVLPLAFIPGRGGFAYLVPSVGWAVYATGLLGGLLEKLTPRTGWAAERRAGAFARCAGRSADALAAQLDCDARPRRARFAISPPALYRADPRLDSRAPQRRADSAALRCRGKGRLERLFPDPDLLPGPPVAGVSHDRVERESRAGGPKQLRLRAGLCK